MRGALRKSRTKLLIIVGMIVLIVASAVRIYSVNIDYPPPEVRTYEIGEAIPAGKLTLVAQSAAFISREELQKLAPGFMESQVYVDGTSLTSEHYRLLLVTLVVKNESDSPQQADLHFYLQSKVWSNACNYDLFAQLNNDAEGLRTTVKAHEELTLIFPYIMYDFMFKSAGDWQDVESRGFYLVLSHYPVQHNIRLL
jgi:hypothetical protein